MAQMVIISLTDDLESSENNRDVEATEQVRFAYEGHLYDLDLSPENADEYHRLMQRYAKAGRKGGHIPGRTDLRKHSNGRTRRLAANEPTHNATTNARAWAVSQGLMDGGKRGRLPQKIHEAYEAAQAGDNGPLNKLLDRADEADAAPGEIPATDQPPAAVEPVEGPTTTAKESEHATPKAPAGNTDPGEAEAARHYKPLTVFSPDAQKTKWEKRTAHGCQRTSKVEEMTLVERVQAVGGGLSDRNVTILGQLADVIPLKNGKVSHLDQSCIRLEKLEMIQYAPDNNHGWVITGFGRYAHKYHTVGG